jgi:hypothetical protein
MVRKDALAERFNASMKQVRFQSLIDEDIVYSGMTSSIGRWVVFDSMASEVAKD